MRLALSDAAPFYRDAPEAEVPRASGSKIIQSFLAEAAPAVPEARLRLAAEVIGMAMGEVGERISERPRSEVEVSTYAEALSDMVCAYLDQLCAMAPHSR